MTQIWIIIIVMLYTLINVKNIIIDTTSVKNREEKAIKIDKLEKEAPKMLAIIIDVRDEKSIFEYVEYFISTIKYPRSMYHIFLSVPNMNIILRERINRKYNNVHMVLDYNKENTSKEENVNFVIKKIKEFENKGLKFASVTIHNDNEIVHPYELKMINHLGEHPIIKFPLLPKVKDTNKKGFFKNLSADAYKDEIAEEYYLNLYKDKELVFPYNEITGITLSRKLISTFNNNDVFSTDVSLEERGIEIYRVIEKVPTVSSDGAYSCDYLHIRPVMPNNFFGIVSQKRKMLDDAKKIPKTNNKLSFSKKIYLEFSSFLELLAFIILIVSVFAYFIVAHFAGGLYINWSVFVVIAIILEKQIVRAIAINKLYGKGRALLSTLLLPIFSIRFIWNDIINFFGTDKVRGKHEYYADIKCKIHEDIGDSLLKRGYIKKEVLDENIELLKKENLFFNTKEAMFCDDNFSIDLGKYLLDKNIISESQLLDAKADLYNKQRINLKNIEEYESFRYRFYFDERILKKYLIVPIKKLEEGYLFAVCNESDDTGKFYMAGKYKGCEYVLTTNEAVEKAIHRMYYGRMHRKSSYIDFAFEKGKINYEQMVIANKYKNDFKSEMEVLKYMSVIK